MAELGRNTSHAYHCFALNVAVFLQRWRANGGGEELAAMADDDH
jgi:hypothetical protein